MTKHFAVSDKFVLGSAVKGLPEEYLVEHDLEINQKLHTSFLR